MNKLLLKTVASFHVVASDIVSNKRDREKTRGALVVCQEKIHGIYD